MAVRISRNTPFELATQKQRFNTVGLIPWSAVKGNYYTGKTETNEHLKANIYGAIAGYDPLFSRSCTSRSLSPVLITLFRVYIKHEKDYQTSYNFFCPVWVCGMKSVCCLSKGTHVLKWVSWICLQMKYPNIPIHKHTEYRFHSLHNCNSTLLVFLNLTLINIFSSISFAILL